MNQQLVRYMGSGRLGFLHKRISQSKAACCVLFVIAWGDVLLFHVATRIIRMHQTHFAGDRLGSFVDAN
jgi:hypothetical protein